MTPADDHVAAARTAAQVMRGVGLDFTEASFEAALQSFRFGLSAEDEFASLAVWGGATLVQQPDAGQWTRGASNTYKTPDLLVLLPDRTGADRPMWIEVKSANSMELRLSQRTVTRMKRFQEVTGIPFLIAFRNMFNIWVLRELDTIEKVNTAYRIQLDDMKESLLSILFNDFTALIPSGTSFTTEYTVLGPGDSPDTAVMRLDAVRLHRADRDLRAVPWWEAVFAAVDAQPVVEESEDHVRQSFQVEEDLAILGHQLFATRAAMTGDPGEPINWRSVLEQVQELDSASEVKASLLDSGLANHVATIIPATDPKHFTDFLPAAAKTSGGS